MGIVVKKEPGLLPAKGFGEWVEIFHGRSTGFAVRYVADERFEPFPLGLRAVQRRSTIVHSDTWNEIPVPRSSNIFVFVPLQVCVERAVGEVKAEWLSRNGNKLPGLVGRLGTRTFCVLLHSVFCVRVEYIFSVET